MLDQLLHRFQRRTHVFSRGGIQFIGERKRFRVFRKRGCKQRISNRIHETAGRFEAVAHHGAGVTLAAEPFAHGHQICPCCRDTETFLFKQIVVHQHAIGSGEYRHQQHTAFCVMVDQARADAVKIQPQGGVR